MARRRLRRNDTPDGAATPDDRPTKAAYRARCGSEAEKAEAAIAARRCRQRVIALLINEYGSRLQSTDAAQKPGNETSTNSHTTQDNNQ